MGSCLIRNLCYDPLKTLNSMLDMESSLRTDDLEFTVYSLQFAVTT
jgi:hypothetical protein